MVILSISIESALSTVLFRSTCYYKIYEFWLMDQLRMTFRANAAIEIRNRTTLATRYELCDRRSRMYLFSFFLFFIHSIVNDLEWSMIRMETTDAQTITMSIRTNQPDKRNRLTNCNEQKNIPRPGRLFVFARKSARTVTASMRDVIVFNPIETYIIPI